MSARKVFSLRRPCGCVLSRPARANGETYIYSPCNDHYAEISREVEAEGKRRVKDAELFREALLL